MLPNGQTGPLAQNYFLLLDLCDGLEAIADSLPRADHRRCREVVDLLELIIESTQALEEAVLFPMLSPTTVTRLRREHLSDICAAAEVSETLREVAAGCSILSADAVGYLLRSFFEGLRRHVHGEQELLTLVMQGKDGN